jgi:hypothetical protein
MLLLSTVSRYRLRVLSVPFYSPNSASYTFTKTFRVPDLWTDCSARYPWEIFHCTELSAVALRQFNDFLFSLSKFCPSLPCFRIILTFLLTDQKRKRVFGKSALRRIFVRKSKETVGAWSKTHNENLHNLLFTVYSWSKKKKSIPVTGHGDPYSCET